MEKSLLEKKIVELEIGVQDWSHIAASTLHSLMDEDSTVMNEKGIVVSLPIEKINYLIGQLEKKRFAIENIDLMKEIALELGE